MDDIDENNNNDARSENVIRCIQKSDSAYGSGKVMDCNDESVIHCSIFSFEKSITLDTSDSACFFHTSSTHHQLIHHSDKIKEDSAEIRENTSNLCETDFQSSLAFESDDINST